MTPLTRDELARLPKELLSSGRNRTKADVILVDRGGGRLVAKDFRARGVLVRNTIGRFSISRECRAYARFWETPGLPRFLGRIDGHAFAYTYIAGAPLPRLPRLSLPSAFFRALEDLIE